MSSLFSNVNDINHDYRTNLISIKDVTKTGHDGEMMVLLFQTYK